jgi:hypothetical protein
MNTLARLLVVAALFLAVQPSRANVVGYYTYPFYTGDNLFHNNLFRYGPDFSPDNTLSVLIPTAPENTTVSLWSSALNDFYTSATFSAGSWSMNLTLEPGAGARLTTSALFTNTFVGGVLSPDGSPWTGGLFPLPTFSGPDGLYLRGCKAPLSGLSGTDVFLYVVGRGPNVGEEFTRLNAATQSYITSIYLGNDLWTVTPTMGVGEAGFFNIGPVPEPSTASLALLGAVLFWRARRRR